MLSPGGPTSGPQEDVLWRALCTFRRRAPPQQLLAELRELDGGAVGPAAQSALLHRCLGSGAAAALPPDADYVRRVLRGAVLAAEQDGQEVCDKLAERLAASLLAGSSDAGSCSCGEVPDADVAGSLAAPPPAPGWAYKLYAYAPAAEAPAAIMQRLQALQQQAAERWRRRRPRQQAGQPAPPLGGPLPPHVVTAGDARHGLLALHVSLDLHEGGTGCHEWEAGFLLAEWVLSHPQHVAGRCCLEIGCGAGMVGVALHRCGAARVILTDGNPETVANCRRNLALNGLPVQPGSGGGNIGPQPVEASVECHLLAWEDGWPPSSHGEQQQQQESPTVVLGADLLYDPCVIPALLALLKQVLAAAAAAPAARSMQQGRQEQQAAAGSPAAAAAAAAAGAAAGDQQAGEAAVYLATTLRNEATLQQFLAAVQADPALSIQQLAPEHPGDGGAAQGACGGWSVRFQHLPQLEGARSRIFLHRLSLVAPGA